MTKRFFLLALLLLFGSVVEAVTPASYTDYAYPATGPFPLPETYTTIATGDSILRPRGYMGSPPIGYTNASGEYIPVSLTSPLPTLDSGIISSGFLGSFTLSIPLETIVALPTAPAGARNCLIFPSQDVNYGNASVASGVADTYFFQAMPGQGLFGFSSFTGFRMIGRTAVATATGLWF